MRASPTFSFTVTAERTRRLIPNSRKYSSLRGRVNNNAVLVRNYMRDRAFLQALPLRTRPCHSGVSSVALSVIIGKSHTNLRHRSER